MFRQLSCLIILLNCLNLQSQVNFNILPDVGGVGGQAMCFISVPDSLSIKIIGHRFDTILPGPNDKPWLGEFDYNGNKINIFSFVDSQYTTPFNVSNNPLAHKEGEIYYYYSKRHISGDYFTPYLIEFNVNSGKIIRSSLIKYDKDSTLAYIGSMVRYVKKENKIILLNLLDHRDSLFTYINILDTLFNLNKRIKVKESHKDNFPYWCKANPDSTFTIIGEGLFENEPLPDFSHIYLSKINIDGQVLKFKLIPTATYLNFGIANTRTVAQNKNGDWIISGLHFDNRSNVCSNCYQVIPYILSISSEFDTLRWQTRFYDLPNSNSEQYWLHSMSVVNDGIIVAGDYLSSGTMHKSGVLFKASLEGDSLWMKHYIPLDWDSSRVAWANFNDIQASPYGTIIVDGAIGDLGEQKVRPWILQLDTDGCLVPGCNTVGTDDHNNSLLNSDYFKIFPNPVSGSLYLLSTITADDPIKISVISSDGKVIKTRDFFPVTGSQYILSTDGFEPGMYQLILSNPKTNQSESHGFFVK